MSELEQQLEKLAEQTKILSPNEEERNILLNKTAKTANHFLNNLDNKKALQLGRINSTLLKITNTPEKPETLLSIFEDEIIDKGINAASGGHLGYIPGGGLYVSALGDYLAAISNAYAGMHFASPGAVEVEHACLNWLKDCFDFPKNSVGNLTSGGSIANLIALTTARDKHKITNERVEKGVVYLSNQAHHCIHKSLRIIGLASVNIRELKTDKDGAIIPKLLDNQIKNDKKLGLIPFLVIASAGTTDTGAIDPLNDIANITQTHRLWFHIDAAYGGFFKLCDTKKELFKGIERADSLVIDPHKGLFLPYGIGAVLIKDKKAVLSSHHYTANYMQDAIADNYPISPADVSPELTKHFRALRMWLPLRLYGIKPFIASLEEKILLTKYFREKLKRLGFALGPKPLLSVSYFWHPKTSKMNEFNQLLMKEIHKNGTVFLSSTYIGDKFVIRMAILSFRTKKETIDKALKMIEECLNKLSNY